MDNIKPRMGYGDTVVMVADNGFSRALVDGAWPTPEAPTVVPPTVEPTEEAANTISDI